MIPHAFGRVSYEHHEHWARDFPQATKSSDIRDLFKAKDDTREGIRRHREPVRSQTSRRTDGWNKKMADK